MSGEPTNTGVNNKPTLFLSLRAEQIYNDSPVRLKAWSETRFSVRLSRPDDRPLHVIAIDRGFADGVETLRLESEETADRRWELVAQVHGLLWETSVLADGPRTGPQSTLGVRWFPFVASQLSLDISVEECEIGMLDVGLPAQFRLPWGQPPWIVRGDHEAAKFARRIEDDGWSHTFYWPQDRYGAIAAARGRLSVVVPVQASARSVATTINAAVLGLALAATAIFAAANLSEDTHLLGVAVASYWLLLISQWSSSERLHHLTAYGTVLIVNGLLALAWAAAIELAPEAGSIALAAVGVIYAAVLLVSGSIFDGTGHPPALLARCLRAVLRPRERNRGARRARARGRLIGRALKGGVDRTEVDESGALVIFSGEHKLILHHGWPHGPKLDCLCVEWSRGGPTTGPGWRVASAEFRPNEVASLVRRMERRGVEPQKLHDWLKASR